MRPTRTTARAGALAVTVATWAAGALLIAPATQAAPPAATQAAPPAVTPAAAAALVTQPGAHSTSALSVSAGGYQGGDAYYNGGARCSVGFNVRDSSNVYYFLTSRRCGGAIGTTWYTDSMRTKVVGTTVGVSPSDKDYALVRYAAGITPPGSVNLYNGASQDITSAATAYVGEAVRSSGGTTGLRSGSVTGTNVTVYYATGAVRGLIKTNLCAEGGYTGGPLFDGGKALGLTSGGSGNCSTGGTTYFQPVTEPLAVYGVTVY